MKIVSKIFKASLMALLFLGLTGMTRAAVSVPSNRFVVFSKDDQSETAAENIGTQLSDNFNSTACAKHHQLIQDNKEFFNTQLLWDPAKSQHLVEKLGGISGSISLEAGTQINYTYFDRGSETLVVMAPGFGFTKEHLYPLVAMLNNVDVVCIDQRGHGNAENPATADIARPKTWLAYARDTLSHNLFKIYATKIGLGTVEVDDVISLISYMRKVKSFKNVYGLGMCYSAFIFSKAAATYKQQTHKNLFDRLILYGALPTTQDLFSRLADAPKFVQKLVQKWTSTWAPIIPVDTWMEVVRSFGSGLVSTPHEALGQISSYLEQLSDIPVMIFQGAQDEIITRSEFMDIWSRLKNSCSFAFITPGGHLDAHLKTQEQFAEFLKHCIDDPIDRLKSWVSSIVSDGSTVQPEPLAAVKPAALPAQ